MYSSGLVVVGEHLSPCSCNPVCIQAYLCGRMEKLTRGRA